MGIRVTTIPSPGIRSVNGVGGNGQNIDLISSDSSVTISPNPSTREIDLTVAGGGYSAGTMILNVPCDSTVFVNAAVRMNSGTAYNALADSLINSNVIGFVESKPSTTLCNIRVSGVTSAVFSGLDETQEYFLSDVSAGTITLIPPTIAGHVLLKLGQPFSATEFVVIKGNRIVRG